MIYEKVCLYVNSSVKDNLIHSHRNTQTNIHIFLFVGKWLFCSKKPPKTEVEGHESTHHQRAHVKLNRIDMFGAASKMQAGCLDISENDKAYVRPGTDGKFERKYFITMISVSFKVLICCRWHGFLFRSKRCYKKAVPDGLSTKVSKKLVFKDSVCFEM